MTVELKCSSGYLVDHKRSISTGCGSLPYTSIKNVFNTQEPYGQSKSKFTCPNPYENELNDSLPKKKKRKRRLPPNSGEIAALEHHGKIREKILCGIELLSKFDKWNEYFNLNIPEEKGITAGSGCLQASFHNNDFLEAVSTNVLYRHQSTLYPADDDSYKSTDVVNRLVSNEKDDSMLMSIDVATYILPSNSKFFLSDFAYFCKYFVQETGCTKYNMIVIDPPWENKSVKRGAKYSSLPLWEIKKIPVPEMACDKALVVVWVTNKQKYRKFVIEELFPSWSCNLIGEWYWVKLTRKGEMVFDLESTHKKPYEPLIIGQFEIFSDGNSSSGFSAVTKQCGDKSEVLSENESEKNKDQKFSETMIPENQIICSVPCSLHSRKPPLNDIFREYLPQDAACIELFARNLLSNWTSWGNELRN
ncbi:methyltransferase 4 isoform X1 [Paramuricea clavata]|uniref:Methyltransferase 4 isoform X1 n=1 Tax=Paramuricea clavata TaxID=317549 RepID=A0A6S7KTI6_PARCT|nr:methyltransferase 4 isoform X1 [Paramuricea clavata]